MRFGYWITLGIVVLVGGTTATVMIIMGPTVAAKAIFALTCASTVFVLVGAFLAGYGSTSGSVRELLGEKSPERRTRGGERRKEPYTVETV